MSSISWSFCALDHVDIILSGNRSTAKYVVEFVLIVFGSLLIQATIAVIKICGAAITVNIGPIWNVPVDTIFAAHEAATSRTLFFAIVLDIDMRIAFNYVAIICVE